MIRIDFKKGNGSAIIAFFLSLVCLAAILVIMRDHEMFNAATQTQAVCDAITTGAIVTAQESVFGEIDEDIFAEAVINLTEYNSGDTGGSTSRLVYSNAKYTIAEDHSRINYLDYKVVLNLKSHYSSPISLRNETDAFTIERKTVALSLAKYAGNKNLTTADKRALAYAYQRLKELETEGVGVVTVSPNSYRYNAIWYGSRMLHWGYSNERRYYKDPPASWGSRDCSSFSHSACAQYVSGMPSTTSEHWTTQSWYSWALKKGYFHSWQKEGWYKKVKDGMNIDDILVPGDLVLTCGPRNNKFDANGNPVAPWIRREGIVHIMIYLGNGMVMHANGGEWDGIHINRYTGWSKYGKKYDDYSGQTGVFGFIRIPESASKNTVSSSGSININDVISAYNSAE